MLVWLDIFGRHSKRREELMMMISTKLHQTRKQKRRREAQEEEPREILTTNFLITSHSVFTSFIMARTSGDDVVLGACVSANNGIITWKF
jgi:hypothetical protein